MYFNYTKQSLKMHGFLKVNPMQTLFDLNILGHGDCRDFFFKFNSANSVDGRTKSETHICRHNVLLANFLSFAILPMYFVNQYLEVQNASVCKASLKFSCSLLPLVYVAYGGVLPRTPFVVLLLENGRLSDRNRIVADSSVSDRIGIGHNERR